MTSRYRQRLTHRKRYPPWMAPAPLKPRRPQVLRLLIAWIDACANDPGHGVDDPELLNRRPGGHPADCTCGCMHVYLDVVEAELARELAKLSAIDRWLPATTSEEIRRQLIERGVRGALLGDWNEAGVFHVGLAGLTEQEARATELSVEGFNELQIALAMQRKRARMFRDSLSVATVGRYLDQGKAKLRTFFALTQVA